jgi:hypothetical protein
VLKSHWLGVWTWNAWQPLSAAAMARPENDNSGHCAQGFTPIFSAFNGLYDLNQKIARAFYFAFHPHITGEHE